MSARSAPPRATVVAVLAVCREARRFWRATILTPQIVGDDDAGSPLRSFALRGRAGRLTNNPQIALAIASATPPGAFGSSSTCAVRTTLGDALRQWCVLELLDDAFVGSRIDGDRANVARRGRERSTGARIARIVFRVVAQQARQYRRSVRNLAVESPHRADPAAYRKCSMHRSRSARRRRSWCFRARHRRELCHRSAVARDLHACGRHLQRRTPAQTITAQVSRILREALRIDDAHIDRVAKQLGLTSRSLQRRLKDERRR